jgi:hypothetical protein
VSEFEVVRPRLKAEQMTLAHATLAHDA